MSRHLDEQLDEAHRVFDRDHARLREDLLGQLQPGPAPGRTPLRITPARWRRPWAMGVAASLFVSVACGLFSYLRSPSAAYGVADVPSRLAACRSVRVDGWEQIGGERYPVHRYVEAGKYVWTTSLAGANERVFTGYFVSDPQRYVSVSDSDHTATVGRHDPLGFELFSQSLLQVGLPDQLLGPSARGYVKTGQATVRGVRATVYEKRESTAMRRLLVLDSRTGMPLQLQAYRTDRSGRESEIQELNIATNVAPPADVPSLDPPAGLAVVHHDRAPREALNAVVASVNGETFKVLVNLNVDNRAILLCWQHFTWVPPRLAATQGHPTSQSLAAPEFKLPDGKGRYTLLPLHDDASPDGRVAHWSLLVPAEGGPADEARIDLSSANGSMHVGLKPLRFERNDLARLVIQTQRITMPAGSEPVQLEQVEKMIADHARR